MPGYYILKGKVAIPCTRNGWAVWMENNPDRRVAYTELGSISISTVFLGLDHAVSPFMRISLDEGGTMLMSEVPEIFETLVRALQLGPMWLHMERYATWDQAVEGHERAIRSLPTYARELAEFRKNTQD